MCIRHLDTSDHFYLQTYKGFYVVPGPRNQTLKPLYESPAKIRGGAQLIPRSKFLSNGIAILNFRLDSFHLDTGDLGKILGPFATAFFPEQDNISLILEDIVYDLAQRQHEHDQKIHSVVEKLRAAR